MKKYKLLFTLVFAMFILLPFRVNAMSLNAYDYDGNEKIIEVESSDTIEAVKEKIGMKTGKTAEDTILVLDGKELENGRTLNDYSVSSTDVIYMLGDVVFTLNVGENGYFEGLPNTQTKYLAASYMKRTEAEKIIPEKDGYTFKGWYTQADGGNLMEYYLTHVVEEKSTEFYAHWDKEGTLLIDITKAENVENMTEIETNAIEYLAGKGFLILDGENGIVKNKDGLLLFSYDPDDYNITIANNLNTKNNIVYILEQTEKDRLIANGWIDCPDKIELIVSTKEVYKVVFDANGGTFGNDTKIVETEDIINFDYEAFEKPTRDGYKFVGFYTEDNKSFDDVMNSEAGIEEDTIFYAKWQELSAGGGQPEIPEEENPKTFDGIENSIFMVTISLIGLVGVTIYLIRKNKVRA